MPALLAAIIGVGILTGIIWGPIELLAKAVAGVADSVVALLPDAGDLGLEVTSGWVRGYVLLNTFLPVSEALAFVGVFVTIAAAVIAFRLAVLVYHLLPKPGMGT